jgi:hypothetical protein
MSEEDEDKKKKKANQMYELEVNHVDAVDRPASGRKFLVIKSENGKEGPTLDEMLNQAKASAKKADDGKSKNNQLHQQAESRAKKYGISFKEGKGHLTPPEGKPTDPSQYADPVNFAYPVDDSHVQAAVSYFNHDGMREAGGYTSAEWAKMGKRIANAAGEGYSYKNEKIVTPNNKPDTKKAIDEEGKTVAEPENKEILPVNSQTGGPGNPEWEKVDTELMNNAVSLIAETKKLLKKIKSREAAEVMNGHGEDQEHVDSLDEALWKLQCVLEKVAATSAEEAKEVGEREGVEKAKCSKADMEKIYKAMTKACKTAGFKNVQDFQKACKSMGLSGDDEKKPSGAKKQDEEASANPPENKGNLQGSGAPKSKATGEPEGSEGKAKPKVSAAGETPVAEAVQKALDASGLTGFMEKAGELFKVSKSIDSIEERLKAIEDQPMPGGPMLRGRASAGQNQDVYLVRKSSDSPDINDTSVLENLAKGADPAARDVINREIAKRLHPAYKNNN